MMRKSVVLPEPEGPSRATSSPEPISRCTRSSAVQARKRLETSRRVTFLTLFLRDARFERCLGDQRYQREQRQERRNRKRRGELILVVENLDMQRHAVGLAADMAGHHRDGAELAHRARVAKQ